MCGLNKEDRERPLWEIFFARCPLQNPKQAEFGHSERHEMDIRSWLRTERGLGTRSAWGNPQQAQGAETYPPLWKHHRVTLHTNSMCQQRSAMSEGQQWRRSC